MEESPYIYVEVFDIFMWKYSTPERGLGSLLAPMMTIRSQISSFRSQISDLRSQIKTGNVKLETQDPDLRSQI